MNFLKRIYKNYIIKNYVRKLGPLLKKRYGASDNYTSGQIRKTVEASGLHMGYIGYGYAMFLPENNFRQIQSEIDKSCDYTSIRTEIADEYFDGNYDFSCADVISYGHDSGGFSSGDSFDSGGFDGGDGGGD